MADTISTLNVKLTATTAGFNSALVGAKTPLQKFDSAVMSTGKNLLKVGAIATAAGAALAAAAVAGMLAWTKSSMGTVDATAKMSDRLGISTEKLIGLEHAAGLAGVQQDSLTNALQKMNNTLAEAATKGGPAEAALNHIGLSAKDLVNMAPDEAFGLISDRLNGIKNPAERAMVAVDLFGKSGQDLLPLMMSGSEGLKAAQEEAEKLGITFSRLDAAKVEQANDSISKLSTVFTAVGNAIAIQMAPYVEYAATKLTEMATSGEGVGKRVVGAFQWVVEAIASATDYAQLLPMAFYGFRAGAMQALAGVVGALDTLGEGLVWVLNLIPGVNIEMTDTLKYLKQGMEEVAAEEAGKFNDAMDAFSTGRNAKAATAFFDGLKAKSEESAQVVVEKGEQMKATFNAMGEESADDLKKITGVLDDLQKQLDTFGMSDSQKKIFDLTAMGASPEQIQQAEAAMAKLDEMSKAQKEHDDLMSKGKSVFDSTRTPMEKYESTIGDLSDMLNAGAIDWETYGRAVRKAQAELNSSTDQPELGGPAALMMAGSAEAMQYSYDLSRGAMSLQGNDDVADKQLAEQQNTNKLLQDIARNTSSTATSTSDTTVVNF